VIGDAVAKLPVFAEQVAHLVYGADDGGELGGQPDLRVPLPALDTLEPYVRCVEARAGAAQLVVTDHGKPAFVLRSYTPPVTSRGEP
jgi:hypothetical protein